MEIATQLALFLDNIPGTLARVCEALEEAKINIHAISISDTVDHSVIRLVPDDPRRALLLFEEHGTLVVESDVLLIKADNKPGALAALARRLAKAKINIEYCYAASLPGAKQGLMVMRVSNAAKAVKLLSA